MSRFAITEREESDGTHHLSLTGELDLEAVPLLQRRLDELRAVNAPVRLDLSQLDFIDSTGVTAVLKAAIDSGPGGRLKVERAMSPSVQRTLTLTGVARVVWPDETGSSAS